MRGVALEQRQVSMRARQRSADSPVAVEWLGLKELTRYASVSARTLSGWINAPADPLPAVKPGGKILVRRSDFESWLERRRIKPLEAVNIDAIVRGVLEGVASGG